jgi:hypothetical protein
LTEYKATGTASYKTAADTTKAWLDNYLKTMGENAERSKNQIQQFIDSYAESDAELASLKADMTKIREKGPELQTLYETERNAAPAPTEIDYSEYYTKGAVLGGVFALIAVALFI